MSAAIERNSSARGTTSARGEGGQGAARTTTPALPVEAREGHQNAANIRDHGATRGTTSAGGGGGGWGVRAATRLMLPVDARAIDAVLNKMKKRLTWQWVVLASERPPRSAPPLLDATGGEDPANGLPSERRWPTPPIFAALGRLPAEAADPVVPPPTAALPRSRRCCRRRRSPPSLSPPSSSGASGKETPPPPSSIRHPGRLGC